MRNSESQKSIRGNIVFGLTTFISFVLIFESLLVIPVWLQPLGRMHPLVLHLPIVVVLLAMALEFFQSGRPADDERGTYDKVIEYLLFAGVILTGITVIMGVFLAKEGGYHPQKLFWHRWTGAGVYYLAAAIYTFRSSRLYRPLGVKVLAALTSVLLVIAGHLGGTITHGDDFIWQPVSTEEEPVAVPIDQAAVFDDVIRPIFEGKCVSCHNPEKQKGKLLLTDTTGITKGGKTGKLFLAGNPKESLLIERLHLPVDDKKHMPPTGKPQLTRDEISLLHHWIKDGANFEGRVVELPEEDTFRTIALRFLEARERDLQQYEFPAVAARTLDKLNSNYRVIRPVAINSPALTVNIYNRNEYSPQTLADLKDIHAQVISLDVARMPVHDEDLKSIARFQNLKKLNLNFTEVTGEGLSALHPLENLTSLSLAGTVVTYRDLRRVLPGFKELRSLAIWDTSLRPDEVSALQREFRHISIEGNALANDVLIKLNPPRLKNKLVVFDDSIALELFHPVNGVDIRYTVNGEDPDSVSSLRFTQGTLVSETSSIKARAYKEGWLSSDVSTLRVLKRTHTPDTAILLCKLNRVHVANGAATFFDKQLGSFNANSPAWANNWAGFIENNMELLLHYNTPVAVRSVSLNMLIETENSIFPLAEIEVWGGSSANDLKLITRSKTILPSVYRKPYIELMDFSFQPRMVSCLKIVAKPVMKLPAWHKKKDKPALLLIDEILVN